MSSTTCTRERSGGERRTGAVVLELEVLVGELGAVDALAACAVATREVAALNHEIGDHAVELAALVAQLLAALRLQDKRNGALCIMMVTLLRRLSILILVLARPYFIAGREPFEILDRFRDGLAEQANHNAASGLSSNRDIEKHLTLDMVHAMLTIDQVPFRALLRKINSNGKLLNKCILN